MADRLHPADLETLAAIVDARVALLADLVAERVVERRRAVPEPAPAGHVDAAEVARRFGVAAQWVRDHADELGAIRLGDGPRGRLRFDLEQVDAALTARQAGERSNEPASPAAPPISGTRRRRRAAAGAQLLPIRGAKA